MTNNAVTPQTFGAVADGKADDTDALQLAVNSGYDVYVPTANRETYRITRPIVITNPQCKRIYSEPFRRMSSTGIIVADFTDSQEPKTVPLFDVHTQLLHIGGLRIVSNAVNGSRAGLFINAMDKSVCDYDIRIEHCSIKGFYRVALFTGRGFELVDSHVGSVQCLADFYWDDDYDSNKNHPACYDQRGISIKNCRLHNVASSFLVVRTGHAYGLHFHGNTIDNGTGFLIRAYDQAWGWNISGNVIQGIRGVFDVMDFRKGMRNCLISGNTFLSDSGYWTGTEQTVNSWLKCAGKTEASIVNGNIFKNSEGPFFKLTNVTGSAITGNVMQNTRGSEPAITISGAFHKNSIVGNTFSGSAMFSKAIPKDNETAGNCPA